MSSFLCKHPVLNKYAVRITHCFFWVTTGATLQLMRGTAPLTFALNVIKTPFK